MFVPPRSPTKKMLKIKNPKDSYVPTIVQKQIEEVEMKNTAKFGAPSDEKVFKINIVAEPTSSRALRGRNFSQAPQPTECDTPLHKVGYKPKGKLPTSESQDLDANMQSPPMK